MKGIKLNRVEVKHRALTRELGRQKYKAGEVLKKNNQVKKGVTQSEKEFALLKEKLKKLRRQSADPRGSHRTALQRISKLKRKKKEIAAGKKDLKENAEELQKISKEVESIKNKVDLLEGTVKKIKKRQILKRERKSQEELSSLQRLSRKFSSSESPELKEVLQSNESSKKTENPIEIDRTSIAVLSEPGADLLREFLVEDAGAAEVREFSSAMTETVQDSSRESMDRQNASHQQAEGSRDQESSITNVNSWEVDGRAGVELTIITKTGEHLALELSDRGSKSVDVFIRPESEKQRRRVWSEKKSIIQGLADSGYRVNSFKIGGVYGLAA